MLQDIWTGEFEDSYTASDNADNESDKTANTQPAVVSTAAAGAPMPDPDDEDKQPTEHAKQRHEEARTDAHRSVGDTNRVVREGRKFLDTETGNYVYVKGDRVVIQSPEGRPISQFKNPRSNTQNRIRNGRWKPL